ncbi:hypothetical protein EPUL_005951 [Erysiphe pulchra]|uniref:Uncharacterized protein n=1 Tax=Erysiphe pulchra TaxID=225359 RepID=A0A2S4PR17_9PEZI|nr:hypothetical protein EPUL_005951 [Erysiphe pulchra]
MFLFCYMLPKIFIIISWILLPYVVSSHTVIVRKELKESGYDCGDAFFNDIMVHNVLKTALFEKEREFILPYSGPLYSRAMNYYIWPILSMKSPLGPNKPFWQNAMYQIVFDKNGKVVDLIVRLADYQFAKCWRVESQRSEASIYSVEGSNGYECGSEFIPDSIIEECTSIAGKNLDSNGQIKDVIVETSRKNHIRCMRVRKVRPAPDAIELSQMSTKPIRQGFICLDVFFDDNDLQHARQLAQRIQETRRQSSFPKRYDGPPFYSTCLLWPINKNGESRVIGRMDKYLLVLTLDFKVLSVAMIGDRKLMPCEKRLIAGDYQVLNSYRCHSDVFSQEEIASAAKMACRKKKKSQRQSFPAPYQGIEFDVEGPYLIYPIKKKKYSNKPGNHRVVINSICHIAGVLTMDSTTNELVECLVEGPEALRER